MATIIDRLPEELLLTVFELLDRPAPSELNARKEPSLAITVSDHRDYKNVSCVSQGWRRIVLPLLFRNCCVRLDIKAKPLWATCPVCGTHPFPTADAPGCVDAYHEQLFRDANRMGSDSRAADDVMSRPNWRETLQTACHWYHCLKDYLRFLEAHALETCVRSFALVTDRSSTGHDRYPHRLAARRDHRYRAAAVLWRHLLQAINPTRVLIVASPADMARLTNCAIDLFGDWAFSDMSYHILDLRIEGAVSAALNSTPVGLDMLEYVPAVYPGIAESSLLKLRPWTEIGLNEGSFLKAYGTYEYFERGPPSLVASIKDCISSSYSKVNLAHKRSMSLHTVRKFVYTAILPFANHVDFRTLMSCLDELDVKLAPDPDSGILNDKSRVGRAQLEDCWQEFFTSYQVISRPFRTHDLLPNGNPKLKRFICQDFQNPALAEELDEVFLWLCMPCWAEMEPGVFERQAEIPNYEQAPPGF